MRVLIGLAAVLMCVHTAAHAQTPASGPAGLRAAEAAILQADRDLAAAVAAHDRARFAALVSPTATFNAGKPGGEAHGHDAILESWAPFFTQNGPQLSWEPKVAHVIRGGEVGVTTGTFTSRAPGPDGTPRERHGEYMTMWVKQPDGRWLVVADTGSTPE